MTVLTGSIQYTGNISYAAKKVSLNKKSVTMYIGTTYTLKLQNAKKGIKWTTNNKKIVTTTQKGKITAVSTGSAIITAKYKGKQYKAKVKVLGNRLNYSDMTVFAGSQWQFKISTAKLNPVWTSSNTDVANINRNGYLIVTSTGETTITAKNGKEKLSCRLKVVEKINKDDFYYVDSNGVEGNYFQEIVDCEHNMLSHMYIPYGYSELNRGVEIGDYPEDVFAAFGVTDFLYITNHERAHWGISDTDSDIVSAITYTLPSHNFLHNTANKSFCFDENGTLVAICWWQD